jgi:diaminopimelate epimerase
VRLTKHHGLGNDFLIALEEGGALPELDAERARRLCDRRIGVGADGLILGAIPRDGASDITFRLWNSDGSEAEVSGNGLRCLAQAVARARDTPDLSLRIATVAGVRTATVRPGADPFTAEVEVEMGAIGSGPELPLDLLPSLPGKAVTASIGNPHLVVLVDDPGSIELTVLGPRAEAAVIGGINVELITAVDPTTLDLVVWERGAGLTLACGSGACVAAHAAHAWGLVDERVEVRMPGGSAVVHLDAAGARLSGPSTFVAAVEVPDV